MSPEYRNVLLVNNDYDYEKSDIFSLGINIIRFNLLLEENNISELNNIECEFEYLRN